MATTITLNRATGTVTVGGDMTDIRRDIKNNWDCTLADNQIDAIVDNLTRYRDRLLSAAGSCYATVLANAGSHTDALSDAEGILAYVVETIASANAVNLQTMQTAAPSPDGDIIGDYATNYSKEGKVKYHSSSEIPNNAAEARKSAISKPELPESVTKGYWNGKVYGDSRKGYRVYIDDSPVKISSEDYGKINNYSKAMETYRAARKAVEKAVPYTVINEPDAEPDDNPWEAESIDTHGLDIRVNDLRYISDKTHACSIYVQGNIYYNLGTGTVTINRWIVDEGVEPEFDKPDSVIGVTSCYHYMTPQKIADYIAEAVKLNNMTHDEINAYWDDWAGGMATRIHKQHRECD